MKILVLGCDGYIGNALTQRLLFKGHSVIGIDNFLRRFWIFDQMKSASVIPISSMNEKEKLFKKIGDFSFYEIDITLSLTFLTNLFNKEKFDTIINLAHIPSGPYSQISVECANKTLSNNIIGTNNILWIIKKCLPDAHYITIGTTGEYDHYSNIDIEEGYIKINHNNRESKEMIYPRRPGSIYHCSKTSSTYLIDFLTRSWNLKCTDVQQAVVFGSYTNEINETKIYSRLDCDEAGGTVLNRFITQAAIQSPLTIYGEGKHKRGFISLNDSIQALEIAINNPADNGKVQVWNQLSEWHSINDIAKMVIDVGKKYNVELEKIYVDTPRTEYTGDHYYNYIVQKLSELGYKPTREIYQEIQYTYELIKNNIDKNKIKEMIPKIFWNWK